MSVDSRLQALKARVLENPNIPVKEVELEVRELMQLGVRCRRFTDDVGLSQYIVYKIRKAAGLSRLPRPHKKFREIAVAPLPAAEVISAAISIKVSRAKGELKITGASSDVAALLKGIL
jgi:hypothetical protein